MFRMAFLLLYSFAGGQGMKRDQGFTLIEIMIVVVIITIGAMLATINLQSWLGHFSAVDLQRELYSQFNEARTRAQASNLQHRLLIDLGAGRVTLQRGNAGTGSSAWTDARSQLEATRGAGINDITYTPGPVTLNSGTRAMIFNPGGQVLIQTDPADSGTISPLTQADVHLSAGKSADRATLRVFGWTSKARILNDWL
jgi:prepilin-type N-terminal cleavage/methylation domain-containing protein